MSRSQSSNLLMDKLKGSGQGDVDPTTVVGTELNVGQREMQRAERTLSGIQSLGGDPMDQYTQFAAETETNFKFNEMSLEPYWDLRGKAFPGSDTEFRHFETTRIKDQLGQYDNDEDRRFYLADTLDKGPDWMGAEFEPMLAQLNNIAGARNLGLAKDMLVREHDQKAYRVGDMMLDPAVSDEIHTEDAMRLVGLGVDDMMEERNGRIGINNKGQFTLAREVTSREDLGMGPQADGESIERTDALYDTYKRQVTNNLRKKREETKVILDVTAQEGLKGIQQGTRPMEEWLGIAAMQPKAGRSDDEILVETFKSGLSGKYKLGLSRNIEDIVKNDMPSIVRELNSFYGGQ